MEIIKANIPHSGAGDEVLSYLREEKRQINLAISNLRAEMKRSVSALSGMIEDGVQLELLYVICDGDIE